MRQKPWPGSVKSYLRSKLIPCHHLTITPIPPLPTLVLCTRFVYLCKSCAMRRTASFVSRPIYPGMKRLSITWRTAHMLDSSPAARGIKRLSPHLQMGRNRRATLNKSAVVSCSFSGNRTSEEDRTPLSGASRRGIGHGAENWKKSSLVMREKRVAASFPFSSGRGARWEKTQVAGKREDENVTRETRACVCACTCACDCPCT